MWPKKSSIRFTCAEHGDYEVTAEQRSTTCPECSAQAFLYRLTQNHVEGVQLSNARRRTALESELFADVLAIYKKMVPAEQERKKAPWTDFADKAIYEGDLVMHPDGTVGKVVYEKRGDHDINRGWRVKYASGDNRPLGWQVGDRGMAVVIYPSPQAASTP